MLYRYVCIPKVPWPGNQVILQLEEEQSGAKQHPDTGSHMVRLSLPEAIELQQQLSHAISETWKNIAYDLAAGGCTTCRGSRYVTPPAKDLEGTFDLRDRREPCPACTPRAERRLKDKITAVRRNGAADSQSRAQAQA